MKTDPPENLIPEALSSEQAEQSIISIVLGWQAAVESIEFLKPEHFSKPYTRAIYTELLKQINDGKGASVTTLHDAVHSVISLEDLHAIAQSHDFSAGGVVRLAQTVVDRARARQLHAVAAAIGEMAFETTPIAGRIDRAQAEIAKLQTVEDDGDWVDAYSAALRHTAVLERRESGEDRGITTGLTDLDEYLDGGMQRGSLIVFGARPSMGKTAIALTIALHAAETHHVGFLSMEMSEADIMDRQTAVLGRLSMSAIKRPKKALDFSRVLDSVELAKSRKFFFSDKGGLNILQVRSKARALKRRHGLDVLVLDYIGLMSGLDSRQPRAYQIEEISRGLKALAKELDIVVLCLAQVNRNSTERANPIPGLSDLRDSGAIEQDADVVAFIHRPIMTDPTKTDFANYGVLRIAKNRQGRCGDVHLHYEGEQTRFTAWGGPPPTESRASPPAKGFRGKA
ncbi:replicative DNA helicase [Variovorax sp. LT1R20]|uniref:replicative DNA helicase n=1 Tax=Variovorax sp. LT1R20 TaxID=3443729 RepID=UPI003F47D01F